MPAEILPQLFTMRQQGVEILPYGRNLNVSGLASRALNDFNSIFGNLLPHIDSKGDSDQIGVFELDSGTFVPVIEQNVVASGFEGGGNRLRSCANFFIAEIGRNDHNFEGGDRGRQPESVFVVA